MPDQVREAKVNDVESIVALSENKRLQYQAYQPLFWCKAADSAEKQKTFLENQITQDHILALVHVTEEAGQDKIAGFVIANIGRGKKCAIDDFAIADEREWDSVGKALLLVVGRLAKDFGISEYEVVCGHLDQPKRAMLQSVGLEAKQYWFTRAIERFNQSSTESANGIQVRPALPEDGPSLAQLLGREDGQLPELENDRITILVGVVDGELSGLLVSLVVPTPPVYDPGGDTCLVTELVAEQSSRKSAICHALLHSAGEMAQTKGAVQYVVMCDSEDQHKQALLEDFGMTIASEWYVGKI